MNSFGMDGWMNRMGFPAETDGRQKQEGRIGKEETVQWKQDRENRKGELGPQISQINADLRRFMIVICYSLIGVKLCIMKCCIITIRKDKR